MVCKFSQILGFREFLSLDSNQVSLAVTTTGCYYDFHASTGGSTTEGDGYAD